MKRIFKKIILFGSVLGGIAVVCGCSTYLDREMQDFSKGMVKGDTIQGKAENKP